uniref:Carboxylic ester hydrolase n=1 Tax=Aotus nancymaae TaxID=37293 RepID=A0A2K5EGL6_AOTNA
MNGNRVHPGQILIWAIWVPEISRPSAEGPQRNTRLGWIQGKQVTVLGSPVPVNVFLGVPFAAPPLGPLPFTNQQPASPWDNLQEATSYPNLCLQNSEWLLLDQHMLKVLYLNIYAPAHANAGSKLTVLVWFPGGAFQTGSASVFDGSSLAAYEDVLVVITFKDQVAALSWVQKNIEFFGGDPSSVTIFGESAGAISVSGLMLSPMTEGLFHKAIMESHVAIILYLNAQDYEKGEDLQVVACFCGYNASDSEALLRCLRTKSSKELLTLSQKTKSFTLVVDGAFFPNEPLVLLSQKAFKAIPSIIGVNNHECGFLLSLREAPEILGSNKSLALRMIYNILHVPPQYLHLVANEYFHDKHSLTEIRDSLLDLLGDVFFVVPGLITAQYHREGATEEEKLLSQKMMKYWANFARTGNPNGDDLPLWPAYNLTEQYLQLDSNMSLGQKLKEQRVQVWTSTIPLILSASDTLHSPLSSVTFLSLLQPFFFSCAP